MSDTPRPPRRKVSRTRLRATDNVIKLLALKEPKGTVEWLLGRKVHHVAPLMSELPKHPTRPDFLYALDPPKLKHAHEWPEDTHAVHFEWQDSAASHLPMDVRMLGYAADFFRIAPKGRLEQVVLVLSDARAGSMPAEFVRENTRHRWRVVYLPQADPKPLLASPWLAPLAVLAKPAGRDPAANLAYVAKLLHSQPPEIEAELVPIAEILASKVFDSATVAHYFYRMILRDFPLAKELIQEGVAKGHDEGLSQGLSQGSLHALLKVLEARFGSLPKSMLAPVRKLRDLKAIDRLLDLAITADSPAKVFAALPAAKR